MSEVVFETLESEQKEAIRPLWDELRRLTRDMSTHFARHYEELDWNESVQKFVDPAVETRIDVARDGEGGRIVGYVIGSVDRARVAEVDSFYVAEPYRGRGIGRQLLERSVSWIMERCPGECRIFTAYENRAALRLYERLGFYPRLVLLNKK
jgi:ribosomal protein S18 acetylase RimI-like enzyme